MAHESAMMEMYLSARQIRYRLKVLLLAVPGGADESDPVRHRAARLIHELAPKQVNLKQKKNKR